jgi:hypothetical protein
MPMKAIVVTDEAAGTAGMTLVERPEPPAAINDVIVQIHASGFVRTEMEWPSTWTDRAGRDRTPSIPGHKLAGVVTALGYGTTGLSVGQRVFGLADWHRDGTLAEYVAIEARKTRAAARLRRLHRGREPAHLGLTAGQGLFEHGRLQAGQSVLAWCGDGWLRPERCPEVKKLLAGRVRHQISTRRRPSRRNVPYVFVRTGKPRPPAFSTECRPKLNDGLPRLDCSTRT